MFAIKQSQTLKWKALVPAQLQDILWAGAQAAKDPCVLAQPEPNIHHAMLHLPVMYPDKLNMLFNVHIIFITIWRYASKVD